MLPLIQPVVDLLGIAFLAIILSLFAVLAGALIMRAIGLVAVE